MAASNNETDLIELISSHESQIAHSKNLILGIGDDAAVIRISENHDLVSCTDTLVAGVHFPEHTSAYDIGWKSLAVNLSDLAAMAATPRFAQLALTLPTANIEWLQEFLKGWAALAMQYSVSLIGGDTTRGHLSITVQAMGEVAQGQALQRGQAKVGDLLVVSGDLGGASLALQQIQMGATIDPDLLERLNRPQPRVSLGQALQGKARSAIDLSDGLGLDLQRLLAGSGLGAKIQIAQLPLAPGLTELEGDAGISLALSGGDDYELLFILPPQMRHCLEDISVKTELPLTIIGEVVQRQGIEYLTVNGDIFKPEFSGYEHFNES